MSKEYTSGPAQGNYRGDVNFTFDDQYLVGTEGSYKWYYDPDNDVFYSDTPYGGDSYAMTSSTFDRYSKDARMGDIYSKGTALRDELKSGLTDETKALFEGGQALLQPSQMEQRGALSEAFEARGLGRSTSYTNALQKQYSTEQLTETNLLTELLSKQLDLSEAEKDRETQKYLAELGYESALKEAREKAKATKDASRTSAIGKIASGALPVVSKILFGI